MNTTEQASSYNDLEHMSIRELLEGINREDHMVAERVHVVLDSIERLIQGILPRMKEGGRLFYIGAGTSGRLGILDASECPPTFGVPHELVVGLIAGGDGAIRKAVEFAEDDVHQAWKDMEAHQINPLDSVIGIAASGSTPYVVGGVSDASRNGLLTGCITCNQHTPLAEASQYPVEIIVGPEFLTGSTRMKAGTAQKMVLNMISTTLMIQLGRVKGNKMVDMQLANNKLVDRGIRILVAELGIDASHARQLLQAHGSVREALENYPPHA